MNPEKKKLLPIRDFSALTGIEESTLRYWDRIGLFQPVMRHEDNNYRLYALEQMIAINFITALSSLRLPLKAISQAGGIRDPQKIISLLDQHEFEIDKEMGILQEIHSTLHILRDMFRQGIEAAPGEIGVRHFGKMGIIMGPPNTFGEDESFYRGFAAYCKQAKLDRVNIVNPIGGYYASMEQYVESPSLPQRFFSVAPTGCDYRPEGDYLVGYVQGYYGQMGSMPEQLTTYAEKNSLTCEGSVYVIYLLDEICVPEPMEYLAQVSVLVRKRKNA
jgi:DNA-binding transcriptional MerR regulator